MREEERKKKRGNAIDNATVSNISIFYEQAHARTPNTHAHTYAQPFILYN